MESLPNYRCLYCKEKFSNFEIVLEHGKTIHGELELAMQAKVLCAETGKWGYATKHYSGIVPDTLKKEGKHILVHESFEQSIKVVERHSENTPQAKKIRRVDIVTPVKIGNESCSQFKIKRKLHEQFSG